MFSPHDKSYWQHQANEHLSFHHDRLNVLEHLGLTVVWLEIRSGNESTFVMQVATLGQNPQIVAECNTYPEFTIFYKGLFYGHAKEVARAGA